jgi:N-glycosylase/DNA lyase
MLFRFTVKTKGSINIIGTVFSGQSFSWNTFVDKHIYYYSIIKSVPVIIQQLSRNEFELYATETAINGIPLPDFIKHYFTLEININRAFPKNFRNLYPDLWQLLMKYFSVRIMRQDPFETMISFMCAQGIGMHLIRKQVSMILQNYGEKRCVSFFGKEIILHHFPSPERLAAADPALLSSCTNNNRVRARNIILAARGVAEGRIDLDALCDPQLPLSELRRSLCQNRGIGYKIADCIALFGLGRFDAFPIDTHVKQYLGQWFNSVTALRSLSPANYLLLDAEARTVLTPELAGYAGHILFHCWRTEIKGLRTF